MTDSYGSTRLLSRRRACQILAVVAVVGIAVYAVLALFDDSFVPLMKAEGWRPELEEPRLSGSRPAFAVVEIAFDRETAERAWAENVEPSLPRRSGTPEEPGIYGDLEQVDLEKEAIIVWSSGESSSCPAWLADINVTDDARVTIQIEDDTGGWFGTDLFAACTDDYNPYRMIVAVDRGSLPAPDDLPTENVSGIPSGLVTTYPAER
ncbi:MAG: hypothetical protein ACOC5M_00335 [Chloroflexota bacterium]